MALSLDKSPSHDGISPVNQFESSLMLSRRLQFFNSMVISPCSKLVDKDKCCSRRRLPTDEGISPCNLFEHDSVLVLKAAADTGPMAEISRRVPRNKDILLLV